MARTILCRECGTFRKRRALGKKVDFCTRCRFPNCTSHLQERRGKDAFGNTVVVSLVCRTCRAEEVLCGR